MLTITLKDKEKTRLSIAKSGYTIRGFSKHINVSSGYLSEILNGKKEPSPTMAQKIAKGLGEETESIFLFRVVDIETTN